MALLAAHQIAPVALDIFAAFPRFKITAAKMTTKDISHFKGVIPRLDRGIQLLDSRFRGNDMRVLLDFFIKLIPVI